MNAIDKTDKRLAKLPAGFKLVDGMYLRTNPDGTYLRILAASDGNGWVAVLYAADGHPMCPGWFPSFKQLAAAVHAAN